VDSGNLGRVPISIVMPVRNGARYFKSARKTIENNAAPLDQIILVDDGSSDSTRSLMEIWAKTDSRVLVLSGEGKGLVSALNLAIHDSTHGWIARFDVDDTCSDDRLTIQSKEFSQENVGVFCDYRVRSERGALLGTIPSPISPIATSMSLIHSQRTPHPGVIFLKAAVIEAGGYRQEDFPAEDLSLWLRLTRVGNLVSVPQVLLDYTINPNSVTATKNSSMKLRKNQLLDSIGLNPIDISSAVSGFEELLENYKGLTLMFQREILLTYDLLSVSNEYKLNLRKKLLLNLLSNSLNPRYPSAGFHLLREKVIRSRS